MQSGYITLPNQQTIYYQETGAEYLQKAPSLLFIHGNFSNCQWWYDTIQGLKYLKVHIIAVDQRGFGKSSYKTSCHRFLDWAQDMKQFCKIRGITQCIANGWSFGGGVSMKLAEIAPQLVVKIILTCSVSYQGLRLTHKGKQCVTRQEIIQNPKTIFMLDMLKSGDLQKMCQVYDLMLFTYSKDYPVQKKQRITKASFQQRCYVQLLQCLANTDISVQKIKAKCLMIHGVHDLVVTLDSVKKTGEFFKNFIVWENNAHMIPIETPKVYEELIINFINSE